MPPLLPKTQAALLRRFKFWCVSRIGRNDNTWDEFINDLLKMKRKSNKV